MLEECDACPEPAAAILQHELRGLCAPVLIRRALDQVARLHVGWHRQAAALARWPGPCHVFSRRQVTVCRWTSLKPQESPAARVPTTRGAHAPLVGGTGGGGWARNPGPAGPQSKASPFAASRARRHTACWERCPAAGMLQEKLRVGVGKLGGGRQPSSGPENRHFCFLAEAKAHTAWVHRSTWSRRKEQEEEEGEGEEGRSQRQDGRSRR